MTKYGIIKLSRAAAIEACCRGGRVFQLDLDDFEKVREIKYMILADILDTEMHHNVLYFEVAPEENMADFPATSRRPGG